MSKSLQKKQQLLRVEILQAGIDPADFLQFLVAVNSKKGDDIQLWSQEELIEVVAAFKRSKSIPTNNNKQANLAGNGESPKKSINVVDDHVFYDEIPCEVKQSNKMCQDDKLRIKIIKFQKIEGGVFERAYVVYTIETPSLNSIVVRRYSDFAWLKQVLSLVYPGYPIPPVAKKGNFKRYDQKYLTKKMLIIEKFLNTLVTIPEIFSDAIFQKFLSIRDPKEFQKYKSQFNKLNLTPIRYVKNSTGYVVVSTDKTMCNKLAKYQEYLKATQPETKKIYKNFKGAATCLEQASQFLASVSSNCKFLRKKEEAIRQVLQIPAILNNSPLFTLQNLTSQYSSQLLIQARTFRKEIYSTMKYESFYKLNLLECMDQLAVKQAEYNDLKIKLQNKKSKLYAEGKMQKWGIEVKVNAKPESKQQAFRIMLPKQTKELQILRQNYGLLNAQIFEECYRHTKTVNEILTFYIKQLIELQVKNASETAKTFDELYSKTLQIENYHSKQRIMVK